MSTPNLIHQRAMEFADLALAARSHGDHDGARQLFRQAFDHERQAALRVVGDRAAEPTRSILLRSAAALGVDCDEFREAERLIGLALSGDPPAEIAEELRDLLEQVGFRRHLQTRGMVLGSDEFQMSLAGQAVGFGIAQQDELLTRLNWTRTLLFRTAERKQGRSFREKGPVPTSLRREFDVFLSTPRAASMAISLKFGRLGESEIPGVGFGEAVIDEFLSCVEVVQESPERLKRLIQDEAYHRNFIELTKQLAPDGRQIRQVGFTVIRGGQERHVSLTRSPEQFQLPMEEEESGGELVELRGQLKAAEDIKGHKIRLNEDGKASPWITVPPGMMVDIVKPMWGDVVIVTAVKGRKGTFLKAIRRAEEE